MFGIARTIRDRLGVPPCQHLASRIIAEPAGSGHTVLRRIHSGSFANDGMGDRDRWLPGICLMGPFSEVRSTSGKLMCTTSAGDLASKNAEEGPRTFGSPLWNDWEFEPLGENSSLPKPARAEAIR